MAIDHKKMSKIIDLNSQGIHQSPKLTLIFLLWDGKSQHRFYSIPSLATIYYMLGMAHHNIDFILYLHCTPYITRYEHALCINF